LTHSSSGSILIRNIGAIVTGVVVDGQVLVRDRSQQLPPPERLARIVT
jgi:hypothetical protein